MNRDRIIAGLLLASWTLNVALGVALYLKSSYPSGGYWSPFEESSSADFPPSTRDSTLFPPEMHDEIQPLKELRRHLMLRLAEALAADSLDKTLIEEISDSLDEINSSFQRSQLDFMVKMHEQIPKRSRRQLVPRMMRRMKMHQSQGRRGMWKNYCSQKDH